MVGGSILGQLFMDIVSNGHISHWLFILESRQGGATYHRDMTKKDIEIGLRLQTITQYTLGILMKEEG